MNSDFNDLLSAFCAEAVNFLVVGAHALAVHGHVRATNDLDVWVEPSDTNAKKVLAALREFGAPISDLALDDLVSPNLVFQIGLPPARIDILTSVDGIEFQAAWSNRTVASFDGLDVPVISRDDLITNKRTTGRLQDLADIERLEQTPPKH